MTWLLKPGWRDLAMANQTTDESTLVISYLVLRKAVGYLGIALPFVIALGKMILEGPGILRSISAYYHTGMRDVFVGILCAIGVFLMSYKGYERKDDLAGDLACIFALGVAFFPTTPQIDPSQQARIVGGLHLFFAASFFLTLAYFSLALFTKTDPTKTPTPRKVQRNIVYRVCGYTILASIALIVLLTIFPDSALIRKFDPVFWLESLAVVAFGVSWLTKGEMILKDES